MKLAMILLLFCLSACITPRVTSQQERDAAFTALNAIEVAINTAKATGKINQAEYLLALTQASELKIMVANSATIAMSWSDLMLKLSSLSLVWIAKGDGEGS